jgi:arabinose-5-phosphate isomerase
MAPHSEQDPRPADVIDIALRVLTTEAAAIEAVARRLDESFTRAVDLLVSCRGRVVLTGLGKSGHVARKIAATLASTGTPAFFLHPVEALHGDLGALTEDDVLVALSHGGETPEVLQLLETQRRLVVPLVVLTGHPASSLARAADLVLDCSVDAEACPLNLAPTASTTAALALGDALAMAVLARRGFSEEDFAARHPAGQLGRRLMRAHQVMHRGADCPLVAEAAPLTDVIYEMSRKGLGMTCVVVEDDRLVGVITDGDLRRAFMQDPNVLHRRAGDVMTRTPVTMARELRLADALHLMETRRITSVPVVDDQGRVEGVLHIHDLWSAGRA